MKFRVRLALLYAGAFFLAGAALISLTYFYLGQSLHRDLTARVSATERHVAEAAATSHPADQLHDLISAQFTADREETLRLMLAWSAGATGVIGVLAGGFGWALAGRALGPIRQITATARRVADRNLHQRIALAGPDDEIKDLADTFDAMLERLDRSFDGQRRFVANASHELRTPLTLNRTLIEVALDSPDVPESTRQLGAALLEVNRRNERLIDGLLVLASSDQRLTEQSPADLAELTRQVVTAVDGTCRDRGIAIRTALAAAPVAGDPVLLERLVQNLVDNAIRYNVADAGWVSITSGTAGEHSFLTVENTGPVVPGSEVEELFQPFRRRASDDRVSSPDQDPRERGAGLGLSIVRSVTGAHGGEVAAEARADGGLSVRVRLPRRHQAAERYDVVRRVGT